MRNYSRSDQTLGKNSLQRSAEDPNDTGALCGVRGRTALTLLEGCWQLLDLVPLTGVLQREGRLSTCVRAFFSPSQKWRQGFHIHACGVKVGLNVRFGTFAELDQLSAGRQDQQQRRVRSPA